MSNVGRMLRWTPSARLAETLAVEARAREARDAKQAKRLESLERLLKEQVALVERRHKEQARHLHGARRRPVQRADERFFQLAEEVTADGRSLLGHDRLFMLWQAARNVAPLGLPAVEIGTFRGGSAFFLAGALEHASGHEHELHVFDSFEGHAAEDVSDAEPHHSAGRFADTDAEDVIAYLNGRYASVSVHAERFPGGAGRLPDGQFGLVHVDVDLERPTLASLEHFRDRMPAGAVIVVDDYGAPKCPGVVKAADAFLASGAPFTAWDTGSEQLLLVRR